MAELVGKLDKFGQAIADNRPAMVRVAIVTKGEFIKALARAGVNGTTPVTKKIGVRDDVKGKLNATAIVRYTGPAHLINNRTRRHFIGAKRLGTRRSLSAKSRKVGTLAAFGGSNRGSFGGFREVKNGKRALTIGANPRAYAFHPGSPGKQFFQDAKKHATKSAPEAFAKAQVREPLKQVFGL